MSLSIPRATSPTEAVPSMREGAAGAASPIAAFALLTGIAAAGDLLASALHLPLPGPVIGLFLLTLALLLRPASMPEALPTLARGLVGNMGLMFVPAGVGVIAELGLLRAEWLPILLGIAGSSLAGLVATALSMRRRPSP